MSDVEKIVLDYDNKASKEEELILHMGTAVYNKICHSMNMKQRTMLDKFDITDKIIKDDSVQI